MIGKFGASGFWELKLGGEPVEVIRKPVLMSRKYLQENEYKSRQNVSNSR